MASFSGQACCSAHLVVRENRGLGPLEIRPDLAEVVAVLLAQALEVADGAASRADQRTDDIHPQTKNE